ncbi:SWI/SNF-related matrix-associated actin-dependent regulator of chromatin subfamily A-like protein 1 [Blattella germanica]|nr:SWI/SNF-related matrix-associated actin-dependent regulator of chromatin subfamily A-like protein 1 [Blattella germanica]
MSSLTKEQLERIEASRQLALQRRNARLKLQSQTLPSSSSSNSGANCDSAKSVENAPANKSFSANSLRNGDNLFPSRTFYSGSTPSSSGANLWREKNTYQGAKQFSSNNNQHHKGIVNFFSNSGVQKFVNNSNVAGKHKQFGEQVVTGNCRLLSKERFTIVIPYQAQLIDIFKSIPSRAYDPKEKTWNFALSDYNLVLKKAQQLKGAVSISELPSYVLKPFLQETPASKSFGISKHGRCLLADDMGLGKTIQALGISHYYKSDWPLLIVAPSSVSVPYHTIKVMTKSKEYINDADILIISYDLMSRCIKELEQINFGSFIMDESHFLKSSKSARTKAAITLLKNARRIIMLSGTPALSRPIELYPQISAINSRLFPSGSSNMEELQLLLESQLMIRRLKSNVISQLPPKVRDYISDMLDNNKKFICFAHHQIVLDGICETISGKKRDQLKILTQAEDRAHRIGQEDSVLVQYLVAKGTADDHLWPMIQNKLNVLNKAGLSKDNFMETEATYVQKSKTQPSILNYFSEMSTMEEDVIKEELLGMDMDEIVIQEKKLKLSE